MAKRIAGLAGLSVADMQREIGRRHRKVKALLSRRAKLASKLAALDHEIQLNGGAAPGGAMVGGVRKRAKNATNLVEALAKVLKGKTMSVTDVSAAVQKAGYQTTAANFRTIVNQALIKNNKIFKKIDRGQYTAA